MGMVTSRFAWAFCALVASGVAGSASAQGPALSGVVRDASTGRPIHGAVVTLGPMQGGQVTRSDEAGRFIFSRADTGTHDLRARRLGYEPAVVLVRIPMDAEPILVLRRIATLDTVQVRAARQGIFGVVGTAAELRPLPSATLEIIGVGVRRARADSAARFFVPIPVPGTYLVRARARGYETRTVSVTVRPNEGAEVAMLLDTARGGPAYALDAAYADFARRVLARGSASTIVSRAELLRSGDGRMLDLVRGSPSFASKAMRFGHEACVFVDGRARPGLSMSGFDARDVEAVEVYARAAEASRTLEEAWPKNVPCADTGSPRVHPRRDVVYWVVIWTAR